MHYLNLCLTLKDGLATEVSNTRIIEYVVACSIGG